MLIFYCVDVWALFSLMSPSRGGQRHYNNIVFAMRELNLYVMFLFVGLFLPPTLPLRVREDANDDDDDEKEKGLSGRGGAPSGLSQRHPSALKGGYHP